MNILILANGDWSGAGHALFEAINQHTDHVARQVAFHANYLGYACDIFQPTLAELRTLVDWCDVVNVHDANDWLVPEDVPFRPSFTTYHGGQYRSRWPYYNVIDREAERISTALNLDLAIFGPRWLPRPMPDLSHLRNGYERDGTLRVAHAPTNRAAKDTKAIIEALSDLDGVELVLIEHVSNEECIRRKAECDALVDEFKLGYGTSALECWAMGQPVIAGAFQGILSYMRFRLGELPFVVTPLEHLRERIVELRDDATAYQAAAEKGQRYWEKYHDPRKVAAQFIEICQESLES